MCANFRVVWTFQELVGKEKNLNLYVVNSKFKKIARKLKKNMIFWHQRGSGLQAACNFFCVWTLEGLVEKKNITWLGKKLGKK